MKKKKKNESSLKAKVILLAATSLFLLLATEVLLRVCIDNETLLDPYHDDYWVIRLARICDERDGECLARDKVHHPQLGWRMRPNMQQGHLSTNSKGFRGRREFRIPKPDGTRRIIILGDSFVYGLGVRDDETVSAALAKKLPLCEVINTGANGWGTDQQYLFWNLEGRRYDPDLVLIGFFVDDFFRNTLRCRESVKPWFEVQKSILKLRGTPVKNPADWLSANRHRYGSPLRLIDALDFLLLECVQRLKEDRGRSHLLEQGECVTRLILRNFYRSVREAKASLLLFFIPHRSYHSLPFAGHVERTVMSMCEDLGINAVSLTEALKGYDKRNPDRPAYGSNGHWSPEGNRLAVSVIHKNIARMGF